MAFGECGVRVEKPESFCIGLLSSVVHLVGKARFTGENVHERECSSEFGGAVDALSVYHKHLTIVDSVLPRERTQQAGNGLLLVSGRDNNAETRRTAQLPTILSIPLKSDNKYHSQILD